MKTLEFLFNNTTYDAIREVIIIDDASSIPVKGLLNESIPRRILDKTKVIRFRRLARVTSRSQLAVPLRLWY